MDAPENEHAGRGWKWFLAATALVSLFLNIVYALSAKLPNGKLPVTAHEVATAVPLVGDFKNISIALLIGIVPVGISFWLSEALKDPELKPMMKFVVIALMLTCMAMSIAHQAELLATKMGPIWSWVFPGAIDISALAALRFYMDDRRKAHDAAKRAHDAAERTAAKAEILASLEAEAGAQIRAEAEAQIRPQIEAEIEAQMRAQIEAAETAARAAVEAEVPTQIEAAVEEARARIEAETEARVRLELTKARSTGKPDSKAKKGRALAPAPAITNGLSSKDNAVIVFEQDPGISGADLGKALGLTPERGRQLLREIKEERAKADAEAARPAHLRAIG